MSEFDGYAYKWLHVRAVGQISLYGIHISRILDTLALDTNHVCLKESAVPICPGTDLS
jgi:hypothetical protein